MQNRYALDKDPIFYVTVACFALLATGLPAMLGQPRFLPILQAVALTIFLAIPLRQGNLKGALTVIFLWLALSMLLLGTLTLFFSGQMERAFEGGFLHRAAISEWYYAEATLPASFQAQPVARIIEIAGIVLGSLLTWGLVGAWFLMRLANLAAFSAGSLLLTLQNPFLIVIALPIWSVLQIVGGGGLVALLAEPLVRGNLAAGVQRLFAERRVALMLFGGLFVVGILFELVLPGFWHFA
ncbi:MAG: hypothetical protein IPK16_22540 [Anaerolineales bacterium]|nr:hypothetical protein [Anaerolineales bacterium]